jgi:3-(3-hydroxy-phenyl)propionate hydroxylase
MTPPTRGWRLAREAALSLSLKHEFPRCLANPRQMQPYTYSESPLTPYASRDAEFAGGPVCGSVAPNAKLPDGSHLLDQAGIGMTAVLFCQGAPSTDEIMLLDRLRNTDKRLAALLIGTSHIRDADGEIARLYASAPGTLYLLRPDLHIAGRWKTIAANEALRTAALCLGRARA